MNKQYYKAKKIFTGSEILLQHAVVVSSGKVEAVIAVADIPSDVSVTDFGDAILAPAFIDLQLYGANKRLLAVYPDTQTVADIVEYCASGSAAYCQPTVATNPYETIFKCVDAVRDYKEQGGRGVIGLHVEGPWLNKSKRGAHREEWIFAPSLKQAEELVKYGEGIISMITLAPEICSREVVEFIQSKGIVVSAGHTNATYQEAMQAFDNGIHAGTHLYNAMSALQHRAPGMVGALFNHDKVICSIVPDGHHVDFAAIKIAKKQMGKRLYAITDAVTETAEGYYQHKFEGDKYTSNGILSGSALTMHKCFLNFVNYCGIDAEEALRMCSLYPAQVMGLHEKLGVIKPGASAEFVVLNNDLGFKKLILS